METKDFLQRKLLFYEKAEEVFSGIPITVGNTVAGKDIVKYYYGDYFVRGLCTFLNKINISNKVYLSPIEIDEIETEIFNAVHESKSSLYFKTNSLRLSFIRKMIFEIQQKLSEHYQ